ncbi:SDR family oxidoreductase [Nocardioides panacisoli]|uniref:SDR family oxidoreductase n=1 Tax=Nocardioides panacisoli TaxID=627624 RepID=UPI001C63478B|nr:SDR family oxidoreductase [Nocardioides panacisoli]QYJ03263.1 SDR family oxidoreductase [Nocardioides panacisoli]
MTVVMAGCGDLGTETALRFAATGRTVVGMRRTPAHLPEPILGQAVDLARERPSFPADTEIVVVATSADERTEAGYRRAYVDAVDHVLDAVEQAGADPRILLVSSTSVYDASDGRWVDEDTVVSPPTDTARVVLEAEERFLARAGRGTVLRLGGLYGPGRDRLISQVRDGRATVGPTPQWTNRIHRDDAAAALVHLATQVEAPGPRYLGVDDEPAERRAVMEFLAAELGVPGPVEVDEPARSAGKRCRNDRLRDTGFTFAHPTFREGYRAVLGGAGSRHR